MQRFFFNKDNAEPSSSLLTLNQNKSDTFTPKPDGNGRLHSFRVLVNQHVDPNERVAVTGECSSLGHWLPARCIQLIRENGK